MPQMGPMNWVFFPLIMVILILVVWSSFWWMKSEGFKVRLGKWSDWVLEW